MVREVLTHGQQDTDLAGIRGDAIAKLPEAERVGWRKLWTEVAARLKTLDGARPSQPPAAKP